MCTVPLSRVYLWLYTDCWRRTHLNSSSQITPDLVFVGILNAISSGVFLLQSRSWVICSCEIPFFLRISSTCLKGRLNSVSLATFQSVWSTHWSKTSGNSWSSSFHTVWKHFSLLIQMKHHLEDARRESSPCMSRQHRWCVIVWSSERVSQVCLMWPKVWIGRDFSVVNLPCDTNSSLQRSHLSDSLLLVILFHQKFDRKQCIIDSIILLWSWCRTCVFFSHSPRLSRFSPSVNLKKQSQMPVSEFLNHSGRNWPNPDCSFYLRVSMCRTDPVVKFVLVFAVKICSGLTLYLKIGY